MYKRLKEIRASQSLNQADFAKRLGIGQSTLAMMEVGKRDILERHIKTICSVFNVSEEWLRTGTGDMFVMNDDSLLAKLVNEYNMTAAQQRIITAFLHMDEHKRESVTQAFFSFVESLNQTTATVPTSTPANDSLEDDSELQYRQEVIAAEFEAEKKGEISSAFTGINGHIKRA